MPTDTDIVKAYARKIRPLLPEAQRAYGARNQDTPYHQASREYSRLLVEYTKDGGSLISLAEELGVSYAGLRRRVQTFDLPVNDFTANPEADVDAHIATIESAKEEGASQYHEALYNAYKDGVSLSEIARQLDITNSYPLYYGVQRHQKKLQGKHLKRR